MGLFCCFPFDYGFGFLIYLVVAFWVLENRGSWMVSSHSFSSCKMRATLILWLKWCPSSLRILRSFSMICPEPCKDPWFCSQPSVFLSLSFDSFSSEFDLIFHILKNT